MKRIEIKTKSDLQAALALAARAAADPEAEARLAERLEATRVIVEAVRERGDEAVAEFTSRFDRVELSPEQFEVSPAEIDAAVSGLDPALVGALERAHANIRRFHEKNLRQSWEETDADGTVLGQRVTALRSAGVYVPGGTAFYPSSVLMNIVPARVAGVEEIVMVSPPSYHGSIHPLVLAAAKIAGATRVFRVGGAQSVAALAYGTERFPSVLKITGPGNIFVTLAKRLASSICDIDKEAGPSEVVVVADGSAEARLSAIELLCQAEHDEDASAFLVATSAAVADAIEAEAEKLVGTLSREAIIRKALDTNGVTYLVQDLEQAAEFVNALAPEHLALHVADPEGFFGQIRNAGAVMLGAGTPVAVGDYYAGPNHILPTGRRARFESALTAEDFRKVTNYIRYSEQSIRKYGADIVRLANEEGLTAHARAVEMRS
ncbi:MAG: histidinol dehydrogenase [FCB group bacterium]|jgi:histidinol dehydrogenase|nr:histidinol dehydrogenase [FCB group bacterium]